MLHPVQNFICLTSIVHYEQHTEDSVCYIVKLYILDWARGLNKIHNTVLRCTHNYSWNLVNAVMNLLVTGKVGNFLINGPTEGLCSKDLANFI
jgi:hypothetical protein